MGWGYGMGLFRRKPSGRAMATEQAQVNLPSGWRLEVAWTGRFQNEIRTALTSAVSSPPQGLGGRRSFTCHGDQDSLGWIIAVLIREPTNAYDSNAIAVRSAYGDQLGYVPRAEALAFQPVIRKLGASEAGGSSACFAYIRDDGWPSVREHLGVVLCVSRPRAALYEISRRVDRATRTDGADG